MRVFEPRTTALAAVLSVIPLVTAYGYDERRRCAAEHGAPEFITRIVDFDFGPPEGATTAISGRSAD